MPHIGIYIQNCTDPSYKYMFRIALYSMICNII